MMHPGYYIGTAPDGSPTMTYLQGPDTWCCDTHVLDLEPAVDLVGAAVHEAGHAVAALLLGIHVVDVELTSQAVELNCAPVVAVNGCTSVTYEVPESAYLTMLAAGERAHQRWLINQGLWSPERAWAVERGARDDQSKAVGVLKGRFPEPAFIGPALLFWQFRPAADALLQANWDRVASLGRGLAHRIHLSGNEAAELTGLANPPGPQAGSE
ncbi:hypothetical protein [Kitasatospora sp. MBT66]|uniref:hypothetical protein n=2 Tax=unclassified Kitasatospora TaxID=2633591 RepID=UPI0005BE223A|nr:hypothetical protein [Kitasatospora sp. MBT66]